MNRQQIEQGLNNIIKKITKPLKYSCFGCLGIFFIFIIIALIFGKPENSPDNTAKAQTNSVSNTHSTTVIASTVENTTTIIPITTVQKTNLQTSDLVSFFKNVYNFSDSLGKANSGKVNHVMSRNDWTAQIMGADLFDSVSLMTQSSDKLNEIQKPMVRLIMTDLLREKLNVSDEIINNVLDSFENNQSKSYNYNDLTITSTYQNYDTLNTSIFVLSAERK